MRKIKIIFSGFLLFLSFGFAVSSLAKDWVYTVQPGDNLWILSKKHLKSMRYWKDLVELNNVPDPYNIPPGTTLRFPMEWLKYGSSVATIIELTGEATIIERNTGHELVAVKGKILWDNDSIRTAAESNATLQFTDGSKVLIQAESEMKMERLVSYGATGMADTKVRLESGRSHNNVIPHRGPGSRFEISTPSAIAAVRGTEYRISAEKAGESRAEVLTGAVGVAGSGESKNVPEGFGTISYPDKGPLDPVKLLPAPDLSGFPDTVLRVPFLLKPSKVEGAVQYRLQIAKDKHFLTLLYDKAFPSANMWGPDLPDNTYFLRVHGIDGKGLEGLYSVHSFVVQAHPVPPMQVAPVADAVLQQPVAVFQWSEPQEAEQYWFQLAADESFGKPVADIKGLTSTTYTPDIAVVPGVYFWRVASVDGDGKTGPFSDPQKFRRTPPSPDMSDAEMDVEEMAFRWRKAEPGQSFTCQVAHDPEFTNLLFDDKVREPQYNLKHFEPGTYYIRVAIVDSDGFAGPFGPYQTVHVPAPPPSPWAFSIPGAIMLLFML
ncbi:FecR domain-containing protein [Desulfopila sp. IMCC35008]|uniref:FecR domain-containing protein n=1 Tax=Desulfopila sp. IMCC35008 TaxID=2653858 RepID=UPI0013D2258C|nr:FecR domain-containing protein [Desulfopila sp. IMCC35008]